jgi:KaiC/GvpD/RAD55 family RecA-like ATPase
VRVATVSVIAPHHRRIEAPEDLRRLTGWLIWRYETVDGETKPRKVPYYTDGGRRHGQQGSQVDRAKLTSYAAARDSAARRNFDGIGFAMLPDWQITALDFDGCVDANGDIPSEVLEIVGRTYAEYSPSGKGVRAFVRGNLGNHKSHATLERYGFETFSTTGYVTFTGHVLPIVEMLGFEDVVTPAGDAVKALCASRFENSASGGQLEDDPWAGFEPKLNLTIEQMEAAVAQLDPDIGRDEWIRVGMALHHETDGDDTGFEIWNDWSTGGGKYPTEEALRAQWESFTRRAGPGRRQVTMASVLKMVKAAGGVLPRPTLAATAEELQAVVAEAAALAQPGAGMSTPEGFTGKYRVLGMDALTRLPPVDWLIKGVLPRADLVVMFGASGAGKTFVALDIAMSIARGSMWRGKRTKAGRVAIIAAEGTGGLGKRVQAYRDYHNLSGTLPIGAILSAPNFLQREEISEVVAAVTASGGADLIVVDTFAQVTPGANENAAEDMGLALSHARVLREVTGATVLLVHHAGKDASKGARGWSGIKAAADAEIEIIRHDSGEREIAISKMKDAEDGARFGFKLETLVLGLDGDGDEITSCVVAEAETPSAASGGDEDRKSVKKLGRVAQHILDCIELIDPTRQTMRLDSFISLCANGMPAPEENKRDTRRHSVKRTLMSMSRIKDNPPFTVEKDFIVFGV